MERDSIDFENGKVSTLFRNILLPTLLGTLSISAVTLIDGIFIGHGVGADGVAAVNIVVPVYQIISGLGLMVGSGCSVVASIHLARQQPKVARMNITQAIVATTLISTIICTLMLIWSEETARLLGSSETLLPQVCDYLQWITPCFIIQMWSLIGLFIIRLDGAPQVAMWCNIIPSVLNALLDWVFIFPLGMGVKGAAIATSISIATGGFIALVYLLFFARKLSLTRLKLSEKSLRLSLRNIGYQSRIGSSSLLGELTLAIFVFTGNLVFMHHLGDEGVGAFGIACYYAPFFFMVGNAIAQSAQPIISYDFGANRWERIIQARKLSLFTSAILGGVVTLCFVFFPTQLTALFVDPHTPAGQIAINGFPYFATGILFFIINVTITGYYQSLERISRATLIVMLRGLVLLVPCFIVLPHLMGTPGIWAAMPLAEIMTLSIVGMLSLKKANNSKHMNTLTC